jgi:adenylate cyclase
MLKKILLNPWTALLTLAFVVGIRIADPTFVESVRLRYFDTLITQPRSVPAPDNIVTVNIDEAALDKYGQWPLSRVNYAEIIEDLYHRNAGLVVLNVLMAERDRTGGDRDLSAALKHYPVVLPSVPSDRTKNAPRVPGSAVLGPEWLDQIVQYPGLIANIPSLENSAAGVGIVNTLPEVDGVNRRMPLIVSVSDKLYPSMAMETLRVAAGDSTFQVKLFEGGVEKMRIPKFGPITTDNLGRIWIDWSQTNNSYSLTELPKDFGGAIVVVGPTAAGIANPVPTAKGAVFPHQLQAAVITTMANGVVIQRPDWADGAEIIAIVVAGLLLLFLTRWTYVGIVSGIVIIGAIIPLCGLAYSSGLQLVDATVPVGGLVLVMLHAYGVKFVSEFLQKQQIKKQFGSYVNPTIVERLQKDPGLIRLGGERKQLSIVMTDLRGFTTLGESFGDDVEGLTQIMNDYMTALSVPVLKNNGTLIKFIGDASLHVHGAPLDDADHAKSAVKTALEMIEAVAEFNKELVASGRPPVGMGAGVNTGETLIGNIGAKTKFGYDVLGDSVSTAARLEGQTKAYGVLLIIGPKTAELVQDTYSVFELDSIAVKGKTEPLIIYAVETETEQHRQFLELYYQGQWKKALALIPLCKNVQPEMGKYYDAMEHRLLGGCPKDWAGYYVATSK